MACDFTQDGKGTLPRGIWQSSNGRFHWEIRRSLPNGRKFRKSSDHASLEKAVQARQDADQHFKRILDGKEPSDGDNTTLETGSRHCFRNILRHQGSRRGTPYKETTLRGYQQLMDCYVIPRIGSVKLRSLNVGHLDILMKDLGSMELKIAVKNVISRLYSLAEAREKVATGTNPCRKLGLTRLKQKRTKGMVERHYEHDPKHSQRMLLVEVCFPDGKVIDKKRVLTFDEEAALFAYIENHQEYQLYLTPIMLGLRAGLRVSEAIGLEWANVDLTNSLLHVVQQSNYVSGRGNVISDPKSGAGTRTIPISPSLRAHLEHCQQHASGDFVCQSPEGFVLDQTRYAKHLRQLLWEAGLGGKVVGTKFIPRPTHHDFRRTCLTRLALGWHSPQHRTQPAPAHTLALFAGHADTKMLNEFYTANNDELLRQMIAEMP